MSSPHSATSSSGAFFAPKVWRGRRENEGTQKRVGVKGGGDMKKEEKEEEEKQI